MKEEVLSLISSEAYKNLCALLDDSESYVTPQQKQQVLAMNGLIEVNLQ